MKKLFVLMALASLAAFQVGCGDSATPPSAPAPTGPPGGMMPKPPAGVDTGKKDDDKAMEDAKVTDDDKPADAVADEKTDEKADEKDEDAPKE